MDARVLPAAFVAVALAAAGWWGVPLLADAATSTLRDARPAEERRLAPAEAVGVSPQVLQGLARSLPPEATYAIVVGDGASASAAQAEALVPIVRYWLLPRRAVDPAAAEWVVLWRAPPEAAGIPLHPGSEVGDGVVLARAAR